MAANISRSLIVLSDGTGNSASKPFKTNVWRLYQAIKLTDGTQIAVFGDGVGTSSVKVLRVLGLALGVGVKRNVLNLYKFLCRNYQSDGAVDCKIWAFGFSRGAFTIRVLAGLIHHEGLVSFKSEAELNRNAVAAYRAYRHKAFPAGRAQFLVTAGRKLRDLLIEAWNAVTDARSYAKVAEETGKLNRKRIDIHFVGVWDTVVAYGLPIDELTRAVDKWVWPMKFRDESLLPNVSHARHALSLDDERRTFHPVLWSETTENHLVNEGHVEPGRLCQVWFAGVHSDVGGGYPDDGLSYVSLCWMIEEAAKKGLRFEPAVVAEYAALATPTGRIYDSRSGVGALWRYQPRDVEKLLGKDNTPLVHGSVMTRMVCGNDGYAPISLPETIEVLPPHGPPVAFDHAAVTQALAQSSPARQPLSGAALAEQHRVLADTGQLAAARQVNRTDLFKLVLDTVWWRRVVYFVSLALVLIAGAYPLVAEYLQVQGVTDRLNDRAGGPVGWAIGLVKGFLPSITEPWTTAVIRNPAGAVVVIALLLASLGFSAFLQRRICDRARAAWNVRMKVDGMELDRLAPTGQRHRLFSAMLVLFAIAGAALTLNGAYWLFKLSLGGALLCGALWAFRRFRPAASVDPARPGPFLSFARGLRTSDRAVQAYRFTAEKIAPALFLVLSGVIVISVAHRALFDLLSTGGQYCTATPEVKKQSVEEIKQRSTKGVETEAMEDEKLGQGATFMTSSVCHATGLRLVAGRKYRILLEMGAGVDGEWFDKGRHADVAGFAADGWRHYVASPLKRWWRENWFQPIARIGEIGNYEHVLNPVAPLSVFRATDNCPAAKEKRAAAWTNNIPSPAPAEFKQAQIACDAKGSVKPNRSLISDITADATGELFLYVNDAVLTVPHRTNLFYRNNGGTATVTVTRILGERIIEPQQNE